MKPASKGDVWMVGWMVSSAVWGAAGNEVMCGLSAIGFLIVLAMEMAQK